MIDIDKDILLPGNKEYGPASARFVPHAINALILGTDREGDLPPGIDRHGDKLRVRVKNCGERIECGSFENLEDAVAMYKKVKAKVIRGMA